MVEIADIPDGATVLDPTCGLGTILSCAHEQAVQQDRDIRLFGQELSPLSWAVCALRLFLLDGNECSIQLGDTLRSPAFSDDGRISKFDRVLCDLPIGASIGDAESIAYDRLDRFIFGFPGRGHAENAFIQHVIASMKVDGCAVVLLSHGFLFRGGADERVRAGLIAAGLVRAVVGLPAKLKPGTALETALMVLGKNDSRQTLFIDASQLQAIGRGLGELSLSTSNAILELLRSPRSKPGISKVVFFEELDQDSSLLPRHRVGSPEEEAPRRDIQEMSQQAGVIEDRVRNLAREMDELIRDLVSERR
jgi:type I restriction enzyme M protein